MLKSRDIKAAEAWLTRNAFVIECADYDTVVMKDDVYATPKKIKAAIKRLLEQKDPSVHINLEEDAICINRAVEAIEWVEQHMERLENEDDKACIIFHDVPPEIHHCNEIASEVKRVFPTYCVYATADAVVVIVNKEVQ